MKVLLINPSSPPSYWSFPEQMKFAETRTLLPPLGLLTVAALLPHGWELRLVDLMAQPRSDIDWDWPDIVMITGMLIQRKEILSLVREAKERGKTVVVGGPYASSVPDDPLAAGCDFLVRGEAENTISLLLERIGSKQTGIVIERSEKPDLSDSPIPRFDLVNLSNYSTLGIQTSRGCPFDCEFCDIVNLYGAKQRHKTPKQVVEELETIYRLGWRDVVFICDDNFIGSKKHARELLKEMNVWMKANSSPFSFMTQASINLGQDLELIDMMTEPNFSTVFIGLESPDDEVLTTANKFQNIKNPMMESVQNINRNGMTVLGSFIIGLDGEKPGVGARIRSFINSTNIPIVMFNRLEATPNTKLWDRLQNEGRLGKHLAYEGSLCGDMNFVTYRPESEIRQDFIDCWDHVYDRSNFLSRTYKYYLTMRPTRKTLARQSGIGERHVSKERPKLSRILIDIRKFCRLSWRQGVVSNCRLQFWKQFLGILRQNPSRLVPYLTACSMGEDMFKIRKEILAEANKFEFAERVHGHN